MHLLPSAIPGDKLLQSWTQYEFIRYIQQRFELFRALPSAIGRFRLPIPPRRLRLSSSTRCPNNARKTGSTTPWRILRFPVSRVASAWGVARQSEQPSRQTKPLYPKIQRGASHFGDPTRTAGKVRLAVSSRTKSACKLIKATNRTFNGRIEEESIIVRNKYTKFGNPAFLNHRIRPICSPTIPTPQK